ncbi:MAG: DUF2298 domain-containing protein [Sumerlaeia bacterium]
MDQVLQPLWWLEGWAMGLGWWLVLALWTVLALPLALRVFRGLADQGAGLAPGFAIAAVSALAWLMSLRWFTDPTAAKVRLLLLVVAGGALAALFWKRKAIPHAPAYLAVAGVVAFCAFLHLPHGFLTVWLGALMLGGLSVLAWWGELGTLMRRWRQVRVPFLVSQIVLLLGFAFFVQVRAIIPWATFDPGESGAEKFGNLTHLNAVMMASSLPPSDPWFHGQPTNYYYGGHLVVATIAKATFTDTGEAFNLGLATIFALTLCLGFSLTYNMVHCLPRPRLGAVRWSHGLGWGMLGALAIGMFGNLDAVQQAMVRKSDAIERTIRTDFERELKRQQMVDEEALTAAEAAALPNREVDRQFIEAFPDPQKQRELAEARTEPLAEELARASQGALMPQFSATSLAMTDFWRSSRTYKSSPPGMNQSGTVTEFPYFSAILGDLHPHHMALPFTLLVLSAMVSLLRKARRFIPTPTDSDWWRRCAIDVCAMGLGIGFVFPVNIWDAVVLAPAIGLVLLVAVYRVGPFLERMERDLWGAVAFAGFGILLSLGLALVLNARAEAVPVFTVAPLWLLAVVAVVVALGVFPLGSLYGIALFVGAVFLVCGGGFAAGISAESNGLLIGARDGLLFIGVMVAAALLTGEFSTRRRGRMRPMDGVRRFALAGSAYALCGGLALLTILPFKAYFASPVAKTEPIMASVLPPVPDPGLMESGVRLMDEFWKRSAINPFPANLRTELRDYLVYWGLFLVPVMALILVRLFRGARRVNGGVAFAAFGGLMALFAYTRHALTTWTGPVALALLAVSLVMAFRKGSRARDEAPVWAFLAVAFFFQWFVEGLHFDDNMSGVNERYNTVFKIIYPLWPMMAVAAIFALAGLGRWLTNRAAGSREGDDSLRGRLTDPYLAGGVFGGLVAVPWILGVLGMGAIQGFWYLLCVVVAVIVMAALALQVFVPGLKSGNGALGWLALVARTSPAWLLAAAMLLLGMVYPYGATANRTNDMQAGGAPFWVQENERARWEEKTLDAIAYMKVKERGRFAGDAEAIAFVREEIPRGSVILEAPGIEPYGPGGRFAATTGRPTLMGWMHHELQWRGWGIPAQAHLIERYGARFNVDELGVREAVRTALGGGGYDAEVVAKVKRLATLPEKDRENGLEESFPEFDEDKRERILENLKDAKRPTMVELGGKLSQDATDIYQAETLPRDLMEFYGIDYVVVGALERERYTERQLEKFEALEKVFEQKNEQGLPVKNGTAIYRVGGEQ